MIPQGLQTLFWDVDQDRFDPLAHPEYAIFRVLEYGDVDAVAWARATFGAESIRRVLRQERRLTRKSANFWAIFTCEPLDEQALIGHLQAVPEFSVAVAPHTVHAIIQGVKVSFLGYSYPVLFPTAPYLHVPVADPRDIACRKVTAIASRGAKRDFVDLCVASRRYGLTEVLAWFTRKYAATGYNRLHLLKSLSFFDDAEKDPMPHMLVPVEWAEVRRFFVREAPRLASGI